MKKMILILLILVLLTGCNNNYDQRVNDSTEEKEEKVKEIGELEDNSEVLLDYYLENVKQDIFYVQVVISNSDYSKNYYQNWSISRCLVHIDKDENVLYYINDLNSVEELSNYTEKEMDDLTYDKLKETINLDKYKHKINTIKKGDNKPEGNAIIIEFDDNGDNRNIYYYGPSFDYIKIYPTHIRKYFTKDNLIVGKRDGYDHKPKVGMTKSEVFASTWGEPQSIEKGHSETYETWNYSVGRTIDFKNGRVYSIKE